jgi:hypothetical protein
MNMYQSADILHVSYQSAYNDCIEQAVCRYGHSVTYYSVLMC